MSVRNYFGHRLAILRLILLSVTLAFLVSCATTGKKIEKVLAGLVGKKIALVSIDGEDSAKKIVEVALVNQLVKRGSFILVSKQAVEAAKRSPNQDPTDLNGVAKKAGADFALSIQVVKFEGVTREGYSEAEVVDTQLAAELGNDGKTQQVFKVKSLEGIVDFDLKFVDLATGQVRTGTAKTTKTVQESAQNKAIHLPPVLRFLEELSNTALGEFFE